MGSAQILVEKIRGNKIAANGHSWLSNGHKFEFDLYTRKLQ